MGHNVYITKADRPSESKQRPILKSDWLRAVKADRELELEEGSPNHAIWVDENGDERGRLLFHLGHVVAKNPSEEFIYKIRQMAGELSANVIDDL